MRRRRHYGGRKESVTRRNDNRRQGSSVLWEFKVSEGDNLHKGGEGDKRRQGRIIITFPNEAVVEVLGAKRRGFGRGVEGVISLWMGV